MAVLLGFDYGEKNIGISLGNTYSRHARPLKTIAYTCMYTCLDEIKYLILNWCPNRLVVGLPYHPDGAEHLITQKARHFGNQLYQQFHLPLIWVDERYSSVVAKIDADQFEYSCKSIDALAAAIILQQHLDQIGA